ncbi:MAG: ribbon-helix-helix domain-containing protein [Magnetococcus sp. DMHC-6]
MWYAIGKQGFEQKKTVEKVSRLGALSGQGQSVIIREALRLGIEQLEEGKNGQG